MTAIRGPCLPRPALRQAAIVAACTLGVGCGGPTVAVVRGTVTGDGKPLRAGLVVFEAEGRSYAGPIAADGRYELRYRGKAEVMPGTYGVAVLPPPPELVTDPMTTDLRQVNPVDPRLYPDRYRSVETSGITKTVAAGESTIDIDLTSR